MGNSYAKFTNCFSGHRHSHTIHSFDPQTQNHGHSFAYLRPQNSTSSPEKQQLQETTTTFHSISGASVSANVSTPLSTTLLSDLIATSSAAFESSVSFSSVPLQPLSGPLNNSNDRGFMSGPIERTFMSGPLENNSPQLIRSLSHGLPKPRARSLIRGLTKALARAVPSSNSAVSSDVAVRDNFIETGMWADSYPDNGLQWAQGKAGEDRVHVVVSEEHGWVFVGIYDGFNGPDATDYLLHNLYDEVYSQLKGLLWEDKDGNDAFRAGADAGDNRDESFVVGELSGRQVLNKRRRRRGTAKIGNWERKVSEIDRAEFDGSAKHLQVLKALCKALRKTEETYFDIADKMVLENPELALMGSCCLVMLMKGDDVYLMNVGDSRAILGQQGDSNVWRKTRHDLKRINEEVANELEINDPFLGLSNLDALQLTLDHSTSVEEEVRRIRKEHPDDSSAITNDRVKGTLKVTRAFGAGFLKQPKWNDVLLEMFRIDYVGSSPYLTCNPFLYHHKLGPKDKFLILSSDGLYQYITNEEAVSHVEIFMSLTPEGDPAQHLVEEVLFRAAKRAGMEFHELLEVPQGDRRRYHDDISIIIISLEGRIWRSCL